MNPPENHDLEGRLRELPRETSPRPALEARVVAELLERGLIDRSTPYSPGRRSAWRLAAAAALVGLLAGWLAHGLTARAPASIASADRGSERFLLLLSEPTGLDTSQPMESLVSEYAAWARQIESEGRLVAAERLLDGSRTLPRSSPEAALAADPGAPTGFFVVDAAGWDEALELAASCPHLAYGGQITIRQVAGPAPAV
jgi:hypothetical protein